MMIPTESSDFDGSCLFQCFVAKGSYGRDDPRFLCRIKAANGAMKRSQTWFKSHE